MSDTCKRLDADMAESQATLDAIEKTKDQLKAEAAAAVDAPNAPFRTFSMVDGKKVRINSMEYWKDLERINLAQGDEALRAQVRARWEGGFKPKGSKGLNMNYSTMAGPIEENVLAIMETLGARRTATEAGRDLMMPFTTEVANAAAEARLGLMGGNVEEIARDLTNRVSAYKKLPTDMVMSMMMRQDSARHLADMLDDAGDMMETIGVPNKVQQYLARSAQYAEVFEQIDALLARKVAQALAARQKEFQNLPLAKQFKSRFLKDKAAKRNVQPIDENLLNYGDVRLIGPSTIQPGSLADQIQRAINTGDAKELKKLAKMKRFDATQDVPLNKSNVFTEFELLNAYRKENLFSGTATLIQRNTISAAAVNGWYANKDIVKYIYKSKDIGTGFQMARFAGMQTLKGWNSAWQNASQFMTDGTPTFTRGGMIEQVRMTGQATRKEDAIASLNNAWETVMGGLPKRSDGTDPNVGLGRIPATFRLFDASARYFLGRSIEKIGEKFPATGLAGNTAGYSPVWAIMGGSDEVVKKMAYDWKVNTDAFEIAAKEFEELDYTPELSRTEWIEARAENITEETIFSGVMTDEQMAEIRRDMGARQYGDLSDEAMRLKLFNDYAGLPDPSNPLAQAGIRRGEQVTFTQPLDPAMQQSVASWRKIKPDDKAAGQAAKAVFGWLTPTLQTPYNGLKFALDNDLYINLSRSLIAETRQAQAKFQAGGVGALNPWADLSDEVMDALPMTADEMAEGRAKTTMAINLALLVNFLHDNGVFTDGGPFNKQDAMNERQRNSPPPYSFSLGLSYAGWLGNKTGILEMSKLVIPGKSFDIVDVMGSQADMNRARKEGRISEGQWQQFIAKTVAAYGRLFDERNTLEGVMSLINVVTNRQATGGENGIRFLQAQMNGVLPFSGFMRDVSQGLRPADQVPDNNRRSFTAAEMAELGTNPGFEFIKDFYRAATRDYPLLGQFASGYASDDHYGRKINKPMWLPIDCAQPFAPCIVEKGGIDDKLDELGLGGVPIADGKLGARFLNAAVAPGETFFSQGSATMTREEEGVFRKGMYSTKGDVPVEYLLGESNARIKTSMGTYSVDQFTAGKTYLEAVTALLEFQPWLDDMKYTGIDPNTRLARDLPDDQQSLAGRKRAAEQGAIQDTVLPTKVYDAIIDYYTIIGAREMRKSPEGVAYFDRAWKTRAEVTQSERRIEQEELMPLGLSRQ